MELNVRICLEPVGWPGSTFSNPTTLTFFQMMSFMNEALDTLMNKVDRISKTGEIIDFHRLLNFCVAKTLSVIQY